MPRLALGLRRLRDGAHTEIYRHGVVIASLWGAPYIMRDDRFEWSDAKARANLIDHGVSFDEAKLVFHDPRRLEEFDDRFDYGEDRLITTGIKR